MGTNYYAVGAKPTTFPPIHIGKSSIGWRFNFHRIDKWDNWLDGTSINTFPQMKKFLEDNINSGKAVLMNEYDEIVELNDFLELVENKQKENNPDDFTYSDNIDGYRFTRGEFG